MNRIRPGNFILMDSPAPNYREMTGAPLEVLLVSGPRVFYRIEGHADFRSTSVKRIHAAFPDRASAVQARGEVEAVVQNMGRLSSLITGSFRKALVQAVETHHGLIPG